MTTVRIFQNVAILSVFSDELININLHSKNITKETKKQKCFHHSNLSRSKMENTLY